MSSQRRLIPSTSMLVAFDAAARTGSFTAAAEELHLTQGAISRQVGALEEQLGVELFKRVRKTIQLTETGKRYAQEVRQALQVIRNASLNAMANPMSGQLNLATLPTFGTRWLMPRFADFLARHPDITVNFVTRLSPFDFQNENLDAAIHYGQPDWPGTETTFLMKDEVLPVCSPSFLELYSVKTPEDLLETPLLDLKTRPDAWQDWFKAHQLNPPSHHDMSFEQFSLITQAAVAGLGVALLPKILIQSELDRHELVPTLDTTLHSQGGYYLVTPTDKANYRPIAALRDWLLDIVGRHTG